MGSEHLLIAFMVMALLAAGCTGTTNPVKITGTVVNSTAIPESVAPVATVNPALPVAAATEALQPAFAPLKTVKDSDMLFSMQIPEDWNATTANQGFGGDWEGDVNFISFLPDGSFQLVAYAHIASGQDQNIRNYYRANMFGKPAETQVPLGGRTFDRLEVANDSSDYVIYVGGPGAENEKGYDYYFAYVLNRSTSGNHDEYEKIIRSFRILTVRTIGSTPGEEIPAGPLHENFTLPPGDLGVLEEGKNRL
jgi:hypothetical protein